jgi:hypothetical protein
MLFYLVGFIIIIIFCSLYFWPLELVADYQRKEQEDNFNLQLRLFYFKYNFKISYLDFKHLFSLPTTELKAEFNSIFFDAEHELKEELSEAEMESLIDHLKKLKRIINRFELIFLLTHNCSYFSWQTSFGFSNPAYTGFLTGVLWPLKSSIISILKNELEFKELPIIKVEPKFNRAQALKVEFKGIFTFRLGKLILIVAKIIFDELIRRGKLKWKTTQLLN